MLLEPPLVHWPRSWIVTFTDSQGASDHWLARFWTRPGFGHCGLLGYVPGTAHWMCLEWDNTGLRTLVFNKPMFDRMLDALRRGGATFVDFDVPEAEIRWKLPFWPMNCVTLCRHTLGISRFLVSPWGLYCHLMENGGRRMFD